MCVGQDGPTEEEVWTEFITQIGGTPQIVPILSNSTRDLVQMIKVRSKREKEADKNPEKVKAVEDNPNDPPELELFCHTHTHTYKYTSVETKRRTMYGAG